MTQVKFLYEDKEILWWSSRRECFPAGTISGYGYGELFKKSPGSQGYKVKNPYIAVVHRLDKPVGGVMVYGKTPTAAGDLSRQIAQKTAEKNYMAVVHGLMEAQEGTMEDLLIRD